MESPSFYLHCDNDSHPPILLPDLVPTAIGRNIETKIQDLSCSRKQVLLTAVKDAQEVIIKVIGTRPTRVDGVILKKGEVYIARDGSVIEVLVGSYFNRIKIQPNVPNGVSSIASKKRPTNDLGNVENKKIKFIGPLWEEIDGGDLLIFTSKDKCDRCKVAAFDLDGTLIRTKSGKVFPVDTSDWVIYHNKVKNALHKLHMDGFKIVIFSNQNGIGRKTVNKNLFKIKIENIIKELDVPIEVYLSTRSTIYRKPAPGMWHALLLKSTVNVSVNDSFYVGDAAGRCAKWEPGKKKDFAMSDRLFAKNLGLKFLTPEEYFLGKPPALYDSPKFIPSVYAISESVNYKLDGTEKEVILMVGGPGSGKSHFVRTYLQKYGYTSFSRDNLKTNDKVMSVLERCLSSSASKVVIDNTNPTIQTRKKLIDICKKYKVRVRCFVMDTSIERCHHNNKFREITDKAHEPISPMVINSFRKAFEQPTIEEGFEEIIHIKFIPEFRCPEDKKLYEMHLQ